MSRRSVTNHSIVSDGSESHRCDAATLGAVWIAAKLAWCDPGLQIGRDRLSRSRKDALLRLMSSYAGPTILIVFNPLPPAEAGLFSPVFEYGGPETLIKITRRIGARIYIANVGGPDVFVPGGDGFSGLGPPSARVQGHFAYRGSVNWQAAETVGGFSNSLKDLVVQIHYDLDNKDALAFDLTAEDRDRGVPQACLL